MDSITLIILIIVILGFFALGWKWLEVRKVTVSSPGYANRVSVFYLLSAFTILIGISSVFADAVFSFFGLTKPVYFEWMGLVAFLGLCAAAVFISRNKVLKSDDNGPIREKPQNLSNQATGGSVNNYILLSEKPTTSHEKSNKNQFVDQLTSITDFDYLVIEKFRKGIRFEFQEKYPSHLDPKEFLRKTKVLINNNLTNAGVLLFAKSTSVFQDLSDAKTQCVVYSGNSKASSREKFPLLDGPVTMQIDGALELITRRVEKLEFPVPGESKSKVEYQFPMICVREMIANAIVHRDYSTTGRNIHVTLFTDRIEILSPGEWAIAGKIGSEAIPLDKLESSSYKRNYKLAEMIYLVNQVELEGSGIPTSIEDCKINGCPIPIVSEENEYVKVTIFPRSNWGDIKQNANHLEESNKIREPILLTPIPRFEDSLIGREDDLQRLAKLIKNNNQAVLINGIGGIGKTVLATAYIQKYGKSYKHLVWVNASEDLINSFALNENLANNLDLPFEEGEDLGQRFRKVLRKLNQLSGLNLLVIDNAQEQIVQKEIYDLLPSLPNWEILLTSRLILSGFDRLHLDTLAPDAAKELFRTHFKGEYIEEDLNELLKEIGYHTLTIELLAKLLDKLNNLLDVSALTKILREKQLNDPDLQEKVWARHSGAERGIFLHLMKAFELTNLTEEEQGLLKQFIILPTEQYSVPILADFLQVKLLTLNKTLNSLAEKGWLILHENKSFSIHRLIRQVAEYQLQPNYSDSEILVKAITKKLERDEYSNPLVDNYPWINHASTIERYFSSEENENIATLQNNLATVYQAIGQYDKALELNQKTILTRRKLFGDNDYELAVSYNNIAGVYHVISDFTQALNYNQKAKQIWENILEPNNSDLATSYDNIAVNHYSLGNFEKALEYNQKAREIWERILEPNNPNLAASYNNIAGIYEAIGQYEKALKFNQKALVILEAVLGPNHPMLARSYNNTAEVHRELGQYNMALKYNKKAINIWEVMLGPNHPDLGVSCNNIALVYRTVGQYEKALQFFQKAQSIFENTLGPSHPNMAITYKNIADIYRTQEKFDSAIDFYEKAINVYQANAESNKEYQAKLYNEIAFIFKILEQHEKALEYFQNAQKAYQLVLKPDDSELKTLYNNIADIYYVLGKENLATEYLNKVFN